MLTEKEIEVMEHALGIEEAWRKHGYHYKRHGKQFVKSYRNYFQTQENHKPYYKIWKSLHERGLANSWTIENLGKNYLYYAVSDEGCNALESQQKYTIKYI